MDNNNIDNHNHPKESPDLETTPTTSTSGPPPLTEGLVATPSQYESVIEDLRQRGMEELAREILRLTSIDTSTIEDDDDIGTVATEAPQRRVEEKKQDAAEHQTIERRSRSSLNPSGMSLENGTTQVPSPLVGIGQPLAAKKMVLNQDELAKGGSCTYYEHTQSGKDNRTPIAASLPVPLPPPLENETSNSIGEIPIGLASDEKLSAGNASHHSCSYSIEPWSPMTSLSSAQTSVPALTQLARHEGGTPSGHPGAYSIMPCSQFEAATAGDSTSRSDGSGCEVTGSSTGASSAFSSCDAVEQGRSTEMTSSLQHHEDNNDDEANNLATDGSGALEAVRVDDIMTVKAEPVMDVDDQGRTKLYKTIACVAGAIVALALIVSVSLMVNRGTASDLEAAPVDLTYDAETRFRLIRQLLVRRFTPLYNINYNTTEGGQILEDVLLLPNSPQAHALDWIARRDAQMEVITKPALDNLDEIQIDQVLVHGASPDIFGGGERKLSTNEEPMIHDRIVERYALAVLFFATGNWTNTYEFLSDEPVCGWSGAIQCCDADDECDAMDATTSLVDKNTTSTTGTITHLALPNNNIQGTIPLEIAALTTLRSLNLAGNLLTGTLPPALAALSELERFDGGFNALTGAIPEMYYQNWGKLEKLILDENELSGTISSHIGNMVHLKELLMVRNNVGGTIPPQFWHSLTNMEMLDLSQQSVKFVNESIGTEIGLWSNLRSFVTYGLELRGKIPSEIGMATHLEQLQLAENHLSGNIPTELGALTAMTRLSLSLNALTGTVPTEFLHFTSLERLYLQNTLLSGDVSFLCKGIEDGILLPMDPLRVDMGEVSGCYCCTCCQY